MARTAAGAVWGALPPDRIVEVLALVAAVASADGGDPLAEDALLALRRGPVFGDSDPRAAQGDDALLHVLALGGAEVVGYAQARASAGQSADGRAAPTTVELLVHPAHRRRRVGTALADQLERELAAAGLWRAATVHAWSHTGSAASAAFAQRHGFRAARELHRMELSLGAATLPELALPDGVVLRPYEPGHDEEAWLRLNARAFAGHPEQGAWQRADLDARTAEDWFDPAGLLLLWSEPDEQGEQRLLASHWTKVPAVQRERGEVYVVAVDPGAQGRGLGRAVTLAGLHHLSRGGVRVVDLYVDGTNGAARRTYERLGFEVVATDVMHEGPPATR